MQLTWKYNISGMRKKKCVLRRTNLIITLSDREVCEILMIPIALCTIKKKQHSMHTQFARSWEFTSIRLQIHR